MKLHSSKRITLGYVDGNDVTQGTQLCFWVAGEIPLAMAAYKVRRRQSEAKPDG